MVTKGDSAFKTVQYSILPRLSVSLALLLLGSHHRVGLDARHAVQALQQGDALRADLLCADRITGGLQSHTSSEKRVSAVCTSSSWQ